jgi:hypothetical protein
MSDRTFYRTVVTVEVLSEDPLNFDTLEDLHHAITTGDCSGRYETTKTETLNGKDTAAGLIAQGSDPGFFQLDEEGNDCDDDCDDGPGIDPTFSSGIDPTSS